jgi:hypothetical protein
VATIGSVSNYKPVGPIAETNFGKVGNGSADRANSASSGEELMRIGFYLAYGLCHHSELWAYAMQPLL